MMTKRSAARFYNQVLERVGSTPGVISAGYTTSVPLEWKGGTSGFIPEGRQPEQALSYDANHRQVSQNYLKAMGIPLKQGRYFDASDSAGSMPVAIINETMARQYWANESVVGKRYKIGDPDSDRPWLTIVGVVGDIKQMGAEVAAKAEMYMPYQQINYESWFAPRDLVIRTAVEPESIVAAVRGEIHAVDPDQPVSNIRTMADILGGEVAQRRLGIKLLTTFAALALLLSSLGIYGVLSYFVLQHTSEIGARLALGAQQRDILALVLKKGMRLTLFGIAAGLIASFIATRLIASLLFGVSATDPLTFILVSALLSRGSATGLLYSGAQGHEGRSYGRVTI
ncbi:MAG: ABC transporter permease [Pyrinomonadaceae bacterium]